MRRPLLLLLLAFLVLPAHARRGMEATLGAAPDSVSPLLARYVDSLARLAWERDSLNAAWEWRGPNAYYGELLLTPTLYSGPLARMMSLSAPDGGDDPQLRRVGLMSRALARLYTTRPDLVRQTEETLRAQAALRKDVAERLDTRDRLSDKVAPATLAPVTDEPVRVITRRPNFWKFSGSVSLGFSQNYVSDNWYQGGENNYSGNASLSLNANFNNQKKITWNNSLLAQLGFVTSKSDKSRAFRPTSNLLRYETNWGYRAFKKVSYSGSMRLQTVLVPNHNPNSDWVTTDFLSPLDINIAPGMRYDIAYGKKKRFTGWLNVAPLAYNIRYVDRDLLVGSYGIRPGHHSSHSFGPNATLNTTLKLCPQITWSSNIFWYSNLSFTKVEWTNTVNFTVTRLINLRLNVYPRYEDSSTRFKNKRGRYFMLKEWMDLGLSYNF